MVAIAPTLKMKNLDKLLMHCQRRRYQAKSNIICAGDRSETLFFIIKGSVTILIEDDDGREMIIAYLNAGDFFGELGLFEQAGHEQERSAWVRAKAECEVAEISYAKFRELSQQDPDILYVLSGQIAQRLRNTTRKVGDLAFFDVTGRVARCLLELCKQPDAMTHPDGMQIKVTRQEIGRIVGCSREMVGRVLKDLEERNLVDVKGKTMVHSTVEIIKTFQRIRRGELLMQGDVAFSAHPLLQTAGLIKAIDRRDHRFALVIQQHRTMNKPYRTLTLMNEAGVLGRFLPEFGRVVAQMQFNMYHSYTVDEHTLRAIGIINDIEHGRLEEDHPLATSIMPLIDDREALFLAMLLHDTGKGGVGGQEKAGARAARQACERLGVDRGKIELVAWLVEHHLVMSDFAQKRDVADPATIAAFARIVENPERMRLLLVLT
eukprot:gene10213-10020_t